MNRRRPVRKAYNVVVMPSGERIAPAVCSFDEDENILTVEKLVEETPFTSWIGGILDLRGR